MKTANPSPSSSLSHSSANSTVDITHHHQKQQRQQRLFTVVVLGLSGPEKVKGSIGVGKSCLCNRFVRSDHDQFYTDHISTLSQTDFAGSPVINSNHWLYWGERTLPSIADSQSSEWVFRVIEQTEFVDDESFQTFTGSGLTQKEPYYKRATAVKLHSQDKLMYLCKEQLGLEMEFERRPLPDGKATIDGFIYVFDVSRRASQHELDFAVQVLQQVGKRSKKPVVLAVSKADQSTQEGLKSAEFLLNRKELKPYSIPSVHCSSCENVNIDALFSLLGQLIDKSRGRLVRPQIFTEARRSAHQQRDAIRSAFIFRLTDYYLPRNRRNPWSKLFTHCGLGDDPDFVHFCRHFGRAKAQQLYRQLANDQWDSWLRRKLVSFTEKLLDSFAKLLPNDDIANLDWKNAGNMLRNHCRFREFFQPLGTLMAQWDNWDQESISRMDDCRIPEELLLSNDAELCFDQYRKAVEIEKQREGLQNEFKQLLSNCTQVTPGKPLSDVRIFFLEKHCFEHLQDSDAQQIYDRFQCELVSRASRDFVELLLEHVELFVKLVLLKRLGKPSSSPCLPGLSEKEMIQVKEVLQEDIRYRQLNRLFEARDTMVCQYASFVAFPLVQHCTAGKQCIQLIVKQILSSTIRRTNGIDPKNRQIRTSKSNPVHLLVLGAKTLCSRLIREIRRCHPDDVCSNSDPKHPSVCLVYHPLQDLLLAADLPQNDRHFLLVVFSSRHSLQIVRDSLTKSLLSGAITLDDNRHFSLRDLFPPTLVLLGCDPNHLDDLPFLQQQGALLADSLHSPFVGVGSAFGTCLQNPSLKIDPDCIDDDGSSLFSRDQLDRVLETVLSSSALCNDSSSDSLHIRLCLMCGDPFPVRAVLAPLLAASSSYAGASASSLLVDSFLPDANRRLSIHVHIQSYHHAISTLDTSFDGHILVYGAGRSSSWAHLSALANLLTNPRLLVVAVADVVDFFNNRKTNALLTEGSDLADRLKARFCTVSPTADQHGCTYTTFFGEVFRMKSAETNSNQSEYATLSEMRSGIWKERNGSSESVKEEKSDDFRRMETRNPSDSERRTNDLTEFRRMNAEKRAETSLGSMGKVAPLVTPEWIDVSLEYMTVKDALDDYSVENEHQYATLASVNLDSSRTTTTMSTCSNSETRDSSTKQLVSPSFVSSSLEKLQKTVVCHTPSLQLRKKETKCRKGSADDANKLQTGSGGIADRLRRLNQDLLLTLPGPDSASIEAILHCTRSPSPSLPNPPASCSFSWLPNRGSKRDHNLPMDDKNVTFDVRRSSADQLKSKKSSSTTGAGPATTSASRVLPEGANLVDLIDADHPIPEFVRICVEFLESAGGLSSEGLYRVPGNQSQVAFLEQQFVEHQGDADFLLHSDIPLNSVATALKNFFSSLAQPLLPTWLYDDLLVAVDHSDPAVRLSRIGTVLRRLPSENRRVLSYFIGHLGRVADNAHLTAMGLSNLAKCWWPTLIRPRFDSFESMAISTPRLEQFARILFENANLLLAD